jgi:hypothetical protein
MLNPRYPEVTPALVRIYEYCLVEGEADTLRSFRRRVLELVGKHIHQSPATCITALDTMFEVIVSVHDMIFVAESGIMAEIIDMAAEPWQQAEVKERIVIVSVCMCHACMGTFMCMCICT